MIKGGGKSSSGYSADLMVCFPSRTQLSSLPSKSISSPSTSHSFSRRQTHRRSLSKLSTHRGEIVEEPTSPKVTCAGQIKVGRPSKREGGGGSKNWESLMVEMEKMHRSKSENKFLGIKKDVVGLLSCLSDLSFDFRCFGAFDTGDVVSEDEEEDEEDEDEDEGSGTVFSKWFMVLHDDEKDELRGRQLDSSPRKSIFQRSEFNMVGNIGPTDLNFVEKDDAETVVPPPNALLLMRCRSAPVKKGEIEEGNEKQQGREGGGEEKEIMRKKKDLRSLMEEEKNMNLVVMNYDRDCYKLSSDIAKETWVVSGVQDPLFRSRSSKK